MSVCSTCGNDYEHAFEVHKEGQRFVFDSIECAAHVLAPRCAGCGCRILGHGVQDETHIYCSAHCGRRKGVEGLATHVGRHVWLPR